MCETRLTKVNHQISSEYVKKSKAPVGLLLLTHFVPSIQNFIQYGEGRVNGSIKNMSRILVYTPMWKLPTVPIALT